jgi:hypothetical protein
LNKKIKDDRSTRKKDCGKISKQKKPSLDALEHHARRKERQVGEALKMRVKLTWGFRHLGFWNIGFVTLRFQPKDIGELL